MAFEITYRLSPSETPINDRVNINFQDVVAFLNGRDSGTPWGIFGLTAMTDAQRDALTPSPGWVIYNSTTGKLNFYAAAAWEEVTSAPV